VTNESWANLTLNEAFANYSEYLWYDYKNGKDDADMHHISEMEQYFEESKEKQVDLIRFYHDDSEDMFDSHSYAKGGRILHMLRRHIGDEAFFESIKLYLTKHAFSSVEVHDLRLGF
jgi:aminopeptidase N